MDKKPSGQQQKQNIDSLITCAICHDYFTDPRILPCSHTYCLRCIHQVASKNRGQFECPLRDGTKVHTDRIDSLPSNRNIREMVEELPKAMNANEQSQQISELCCRNCSSKAVTHWCNDCKQEFCDACCTKLHQPPAFAQHQRMPIQQKPKLCVDHPKEEVRYWCSCETSICRDCPHSKKHKNHSPVLIEDVISDITEELKTGLTNAKIFVGELKNNDENVNVKRITQIFNTIRETINTYEENLKKNILAIEQKNKTQIEQYLKSIKSKQNTLLEENKKFEQLYSSKDYVTLLQDKTRLTNVLQQIKNELQTLNKPILLECRIEGVDQLPTKINEVLQKAKVIEQKTGDAQFALSGIYEQLDCDGRACVTCGKCRDWYYTGDQGSWNWIRNVANWKEDDVKRWDNGRYWERFKRRDGYTCCRGHSGDLDTKSSTPYGANASYAQNRIEEMCIEENPRAYGASRDCAQNPIEEMCSDEENPRQNRIERKSIAYGASRTMSSAQKRIDRAQNRIAQNPIEQMCSDEENPAYGASRTMSSAQKRIRDHPYLPLLCLCGDNWNK